MRKIFVTGIGTDVGKTVVSAILTEALKADYWKPIQTGSFSSTDTSKVKKWVTNPKSKFHPEGYLLQQYASPHAAAEAEGIEIDLDLLMLPNTNNTLIIEGAGGLMVPINRNTFMIDLIKKFDAEVILVVKNYLGSINHSLLSIDALKQQSVKIMGLIINGVPNASSEEVILHYSGLKLVGRIYPEKEIASAVISKYATAFEYLK